MIRQRCSAKAVNIKNDPIAFYFLNQLIEAESDKQNFSSRDELDGTIDQQLDLVLQYGVLVNYGLPFPLVFLVAFFTNLLQMKVPSSLISRSNNYVC
jgi:hypothetical protein